MLESEGENEEHIECGHALCFRERSIPWREIKRERMKNREYYTLVREYSLRVRVCFILPRVGERGRERE